MVDPLAKVSLGTASLVQVGVPLLGRQLHGGNENVSSFLRIGVHDSPATEDSTFQCDNHLGNVRANSQISKFVGWVYSSNANSPMASRVALSPGASFR